MLHHLHIFGVFLGTRQAQLIILSALALISISYFILSPKAEELTEKPSVERSSVWDADYSNPQTEYQQTKRYDSYVPLVPIPPKPEIVEVRKPARVDKAVTIPKPVIPIQLQVPIVKMQRKPTEVAETKAPTIFKPPELELGATLYCKLSTPATTDNPSTAVIAVLTRSVVRDGITVIPRGSKLIGKVQKAVNNRIFFSDNWTLLTPSNDKHSILGDVQEVGRDGLTGELKPFDGRLGLPGTLVSQERTKRLNPKIIRTIAKGVSQFGKETVRTSVGEFVPASGRNAVITGGSAVIDGLFTPKQSETIQPQSYVRVYSGTEFYLVVSEMENQPGTHGNEVSIDQLLQESLRQRLNQRR